MKLEQSFEVNAPLEKVWEALIDVERVAPCLPGASVTGRNDDGSYNGEFKVKVGPTSAAYAGKLNMEELDADAHKATMSASGTDKRGQGGANATIVSTVTAEGDGAAKVDVSTDYHITGKLARFGRGGMIEAISNKLLGEFASNLQAMLAGGGASDAGESSGAGGPAGGEGSSDAVGSADAGGSSGAGSADAAAAPGAAAAAPASTVSATDAAANGSGADAPAPTTAAGSSGSASGAASGAASAGGASAGGSAAGASSEPLSAGSLVGSVLLERIKSKPAALVAAVAGFLAALRIRRRRRAE